MEAGPTPNQECIHLNSHQIVVAFSLAVLLVNPSSAYATVPSDLCTGDPCVVSEDITVDAGSALDFTGQSVVITSGTTITIGPGAGPRVLHIVADDITMQQNAKIDADGDGGDITLESLVGSIVMESEGSNRSQVLAKADVDTAGTISILSFGDATLIGILDASAFGVDATGGDIEVRANGSVVFGEDITAEAGGNGAGGGDIRVIAGLDVTIDDRLISSGGDFGAGDIDILAAGTVTVNARMLLDGDAPDGEAGQLDIEAGVDIVIAATGELFGRGGANAPTEDCGDGSSMNLISGNHIIVHGDIDARGGLHCFGGDQTYEARLDFVQHPTSSIVTATGGFFGASGLVDIEADRSATLGKIDISAAGFASDVTVFAPHSIQVLDKVSVRGNGNPESIGGQINLQSCTIDILSPDGELDARSPFVFNSFGSTFMRAGGQITVSGDLQAASPTETQPNVGNFVRYRSLVPSITGSVSPAAITTLDASLPECGYCGDNIVQASLGETCDDGGTASCDGCAGYCQRFDNVCGDGFLECGEECDDGNETPGDGCEADCTVGPIVTPTPGPSPSPTPDPTPSPSPTATPTPAPTASPSPTPSPAPTATPSPTETPSPSPTQTPVGTPTPPAAGGLDFYGIEPCRVINTFEDPGAGGGASEPLFANVEREFPVTGVCGIPGTAQGVSAVVTVVLPTAPGFVTLFPADGPRPVVSAINFPAGGVMNNNTLLKLSSDGSGAIRAFLPTGEAHLIFDVNGYFQ